VLQLPEVQLVLGEPGLPEEPQVLLRLARLVQLNLYLSR
jgi:hypothetical protein